MEVFTQVRARRLEEVAAITERAEAAGYDGVSLTSLSLEPYLASALAAKATSRVIVNTSIALAFPMSPTYTAWLAWHLQDLSHGRFSLGLGTQVKAHIERRFGVPWSPPMPWMREYIQAVRAVLNNWRDGAKLDHRGPRYTINLMTPEFTPDRTEWTAKRVPIELAAVNGRMANLAGQACDGISMHSLTSRTYAKKAVLPEVEAGARSAGRTLADLVVRGGGFVATGASREEVAREREEVRRRISFYASTRTYKPAMDIHGLGDLTMKLHQMSLRGAWKEMPGLISDEVVDTFCVSGTYDEIGGAIRERCQGWANRVALPLPEDPRHDRLVQRAVEQIKG